MSELKKTLSFGGLAVLLGVVALVSAPGRATPDAFFDIGDTFFPTSPIQTRPPHSRSSSSTARPRPRCRFR